MAHTMNMSGTKWEIFQAAVNLFARDGYHNVSVKQIAAEAGLGAGSIYNHFSCKDAILEQMYQFYDYYIRAHSMDLDQLLGEVGTTPHRELLYKVIYHFSPGLQENMDKIMTVTANMTSDIRAKLLIWNNFFTLPQKYFTPLLNRMLELELIEPIDVEAFVRMFSCIAHSCALQMVGPHPVSKGFYRRMLEMLFGLVREKAK